MVLNPSTTQITGGGEEPTQMDVTGAQVVDISIRADGTVIWINIDNVCKLRVCRIKKLIVEDNRPDGGDMTGGSRDT